MPRLLLKKGIRLYLKDIGMCGKVKAKNDIIGICRAGLDTLRAASVYTEPESLLAASQRNIIKQLLMRGPKAHEEFRRILRPNTFLNQKSALCCRILFASTEVMQTPKSNFPLHIDIENIHHIRTEK